MYLTFIHVFEHYQNTLNHSSVTPSADLDDFADSATPDVMVSEDVPMLHFCMK